MRSTFKVLFYVKKGSEKPNGNLPLMCRITVDGEAKQFSCKIQPANLLRRQPVDYHPQTENQHRFQYPAVGRS